MKKELAKASGLNLAAALHRLRRSLRTHDGPADPQRRLPARYQTIERTRHFRHETRKRAGEFGRRRAGGIGGAPHHHAAGLVEFRERQPRRLLRGGIEQHMRPAASQSDQRGDCGSPATDSNGRPTRRTKFSSKIRRSRLQASAVCHFRAADPRQKQRRHDHDNRRHDHEKTPIPCAELCCRRRKIRSPSATITASPDSSSAIPAAARAPDPADTKPAIRLSAIAGASAKQIDKCRANGSTDGR